MIRKDNKREVFAGLDWNTSGLVWKGSAQRIVEEAEEQKQVSSPRRN